MPLYLSFLLIIIYSKYVFAQGKEANNWYFGNKAGITFQQGSPPVALLDGQSVSPVETGTACISDKDGNLLFYSNGTTIWNKNHQVMTNGDNMGMWSTQGGMIVNDPGNENRYYFFNFAITGAPPAPLKFQYSVIDMTNGLGEVLPDQKGIFLYLNTTYHLSAIMHENMEDVWVVTHGLGINSFIAFRVTSTGVITTPEISYAGTSYTSATGYMKISSDGKWLGIGNFYQFLTELYHFDNSTGVVSNENVVTIPVRAWGVEFSPDNTKFYAHGNYLDFYQYDLTSNDPAQIAASAVSLTNEMFGVGALQLGPDGKIYVGYGGEYLGVIHDPDKKGLFCNFEFHAIYLEGRTYLDGLPVFMQSYMRNPEFTAAQYCAGQPTQFNIINTNGIDSVYWQFHDAGNAPNDTSTLFAPSYTFSTADTFYVSLTAYSGLLHRTVIDTVIIFQTPIPYLGNDTTFCPNDPINLTLDAGPGTTYNWNGSLTPGDSTLVINDIGIYTVRVSDHGCIGRDTINVSRYAAATADTSGYTLKNSNCNLSDGSITGIVFNAEQPFTITWTNASGTQVGTGSDLTGIPAGSYTAEVTFGSNCVQSFGPYDINDNGAIQIGNISKQDDHCSQLLGSLLVVPETGNPDEYSYSINGTDYFDNGGVFNSLPAGAYTITIRNQSGCISVVVHDTIADIPGPDVNCISVPATGTNADGSITVISSGTGLVYQLEGYPPQTENTFGNLIAATYYVTVTDEFGCITYDTVVVENLEGSLLVALADKDRKCLYKPANSGIKITRVNGLKDLKAVLYYNDNILNCTNFNPNSSDFPGIKATMYSIPPRIEIVWNGINPLFNADTLTMGTLIFETKQSGSADINWEPNTMVTYFLNQNADNIQPVLIPGIIEVHEIPEAAITGLPVICEGDDATIEAAITGGTEPVEYHWQTPGGEVTTNTIPVLNASARDAGSYTFYTSDFFNCADTARFTLKVVPLPTANFPEINDTIWYEQTYLLEATPGYSNYEWSTGDTTYYINITDEGEYSIILQTEEGCRSADTIMMMNAFVPIYIPNAFTPNGDGLNDVFRPVVDLELVKQFHLSIYNKWGERIFETSAAGRGWDGKNAQPGVYVWVITYENRVGKVSETRGCVTVIK